MFLNPTSVILNLRLFFLNPSRVFLNPFRSFCIIRPGVRGCVPDITLSLLSCGLFESASAGVSLPHSPMKQSRTRQGRAPAHVTLQPYAIQMTLAPPPRRVMRKTSVRHWPHIRARTSGSLHFLHPMCKRTETTTCVPRTRPFIPSSTSAFAAASAAAAAAAAEWSV